MNILILEDDLLAADFIEKLITDHFEGFNIVGKAQSVKEASRIYNSTNPDLLIMDINLGDHNSFDLFEYINPSELTVIFTSSYDEFALKAIKVDAVDYLLKPINIQEFKLAIGKVEERIKYKTFRSQDGQNSIQNESGFHKILIYEDKKMRPVEIDHIIKIKSKGTYSHLYLQNKKIIVSTRNIGLYEKLLQDRWFIRIHDSCLINSKHVLKYQGGAQAYVTLSDGSIENISKTKKKDFLTIFRSEN